jgi:hypothetical protein
LSYGVASRGHREIFLFVPLPSGTNRNVPSQDLCPLEYHEKSLWVH